MELSELIEKEKVKEILKKYLRSDSAKLQKVLEKIDEESLPKGVAVVGKAKWRSYHEADFGWDEYGIECSECGFRIESEKVTVPIHMCPRCLSYMGLPK